MPHQPHRARVLAFDRNRRKAQPTSATNQAADTLPQPDPDRPRSEWLTPKGLAHAYALARSLGISYRDMMADSRLYYHADALLAIEAAYGITDANDRQNGRAAALTQLFEYFDDGHQAGVDDGRMLSRRPDAR